MPNARKKGKKFVGAWVSTKLYRDLQRAASQRETTVTAIIDELLNQNVPGMPDLLHDTVPNSARVDAALGAIVTGGVAQALDPASDNSAPEKPVKYSIPRRSKRKRPPAHDAKPLP